MWEEESRFGLNLWGRVDEVGNKNYDTFDKGNKYKGWVDFI